MHNMLDPAILFFVFGVLAGTVRSNLEIPPAISRFLSLYLLMALGLKGGFALAQSGLTVEVGAGLTAAMGLAVIVPLVGYSILKRILSGFDAAAVAAAGWRQVVAVRLSLVSRNTEASPGYTDRATYPLGLRGQVAATVGPFNDTFKRRSATGTVLGFLGAAVMTPQETAEKIAQVRAGTERPFGVNFHMFQPGAVEIVETIIANMR